MNAGERTGLSAKEPFGRNGMMKRSMIASGALHFAVIAAATVAWPHALDLSAPPWRRSSSSRWRRFRISRPRFGGKQKPDSRRRNRRRPSPNPRRRRPNRSPKWRLPGQDPHAQAQGRAQASRADRPPQSGAAPAKPAPEQQQNFNVDTVIALLDKRSPKPVAPPSNVKPAETTVKGIGAQDAMIATRWSIP